jgi:hypothetical protein
MRLTGEWFGEHLSLAGPPGAATLAHTDEPQLTASSKLASNGIRSARSTSGSRPS